MSQLQPHFLFNTLNSLIALIYEGKYRELEDGLYNLSDLLRYVLRKDNLVTLGEEIRFISSYLMLQKERFGTRLTGEFRDTWNGAEGNTMPYFDKGRINGF